MWATYWRHSQETFNEKGLTFKFAVEPELKKETEAKDATELHGGMYESKNEWVIKYAMEQPGQAAVSVEKGVSP